LYFKHKQNINYFASIVHNLFYFSIGRIFAQVKDNFTDCYNLFIVSYM